MLNATVKHANAGAIMTEFTKFEDIVTSGKKYKIIYADPPWSYDDKLNHHGGSASSHYSEMSVEEICDLPVKQISDKDCVLFMWGTWPKLQEALQVIEAWGFDYKTIGFVWVKKYKSGKSFFGMGRWTRGNTEFCLIGVKGKPKRHDNAISQIIDSIAKQHSKKPNEVRTKILTLCGDLPRIELFARTKISGWDVFGNDEKLQNTPLEEFLT